MAAVDACAINSSAPATGFVMALANPLPTSAITDPVPRLGSEDMACIDKLAKSETAPSSPRPSPSMPSARLGRMPATKADESVVEDTSVDDKDEEEEKEDEEEEEEEYEEEDIEPRIITERSKDTRELLFLLPPSSMKEEKEDEAPLALIIKYAIPPTLESSLQRNKGN